MVNISDPWILYLKAQKLEPQPKLILVKPDCSTKLNNAIVYSRLFEDVGHVVSKSCYDPNEVAKYITALEEAAANDSSAAAFTLGEIYQQGKFELEPDLPQSCLHYQRAWDGDDPPDPEMLIELLDKMKRVGAPDSLVDAARSLKDMIQQNIGLTICLPDYFSSTR